MQIDFRLELTTLPAPSGPRCDSARTLVCSYENCIVQYPPHARTHFPVMGAQAQFSIDDIGDQMAAAVKESLEQMTDNMLTAKVAEIKGAATQHSIFDFRAQILSR